MDAVVSGIGQSASWVQLTGGYTHVVSGTLSNLNFYIEGPAAGVDRFGGACGGDRTPDESLVFCRGAPYGTAAGWSGQGGSL